MKRKTDKRALLLRSARSLFYKQGYRQTSLAHIAEHSGVPLGNIYYYFKSKEQLVHAVVQDRTERFKALAETWEDEPDPVRRLLAFLEMPTTLAGTIAKHGCPVGSLTQEFCKAGLDGDGSGGETLQAHIAWVTEQFRLMGKSDPDELGHHFVATLQGACLLAGALKKPEVLLQQVRRLEDELRQ